MSYDNCGCPALCGSDTAELGGIAGPGVYVTEVCTSSRYYMKGFFNAIESFRFACDIDGLRLDEAILTIDLLEQNNS